MHLENSATSPKPLINLSVHKQEGEMRMHFSKACAEASAATASRNEDAQKLVQKRKAAAANAKHALFRNQARKQLPGAKLNLKRKKEESRAQEHEHIHHLPMDADTKAIFRSLNVPVDTIAGAGLFADVWCDTDEDEDEDEL